MYEDQGKRSVNPSRRAFLAAGVATAAGPVLLHASAEAEEIPPWQQTSDRKIRIGVVGGGFGANFHWHEDPNCIVEAVSDLRADRRDLLMKKYGCKKPYESLEKLVLDPAVEAVAIFTPAPDHARHMAICMEHGKHVISACPACMTLEEAAKMKAVKERTGLKYMNAETSYFRWQMQRAREFYAAGDLGEVIYCEAEYYHPGIGYAEHGLSRRADERTWRYGFPPMLYPTHSTAFLVGMTKERLNKVSCVGLRETEDPAFKDNVYGNPFCNGMAMYLTDHGRPFRCNVAWKIAADGERAQWFGTKGSVYMQGSAGRPFAVELGNKIIRDPGKHFWAALPEKMRYDTGHGRSHPFLTHEFITALAEEREPVIDLYESLAFCVPGIVAHQSSFKDGEQLAIPSFDRV